MPPAISDRARRQNLQIICAFIEKRLGMLGGDRWSIDGLDKRDIVSLLCLLVDLAHKLECPYPLPSQVSVALLHTETVGGAKKTKTTMVPITTDESQYRRADMLMGAGSQSSMADLSASMDALQNNKADPFDSLFEPQHRGELDQIQHLLLEFVNGNMQQLDVQVTDLSAQMHDGVVLIQLTGLLANFFVPLVQYDLDPQSYDAKLSNVTFAFKLLESIGIHSTKWSAIDVVNQDLKMSLRISYDIFRAFRAPPRSGSRDQLAM